MSIHGISSLPLVTQQKSEGANHPALHGAEQYTQLDRVLLSTSALEQLVAAEPGEILPQDSLRAVATPEGPSSISPLGSMDSIDIEALCLLVLMQAAKSSQEDLKAIMDEAKKANESRQTFQEMNGHRESHLPKFVS